MMTSRITIFAECKVDRSPCVSKIRGGVSDSPLILVEMMEMLK